MRRYTREASPDFLTTRWEQWGERYKNNRIRSYGFVFKWPTFQGKKINTLLEPALSNQTDGHCSFCDTYPDRGKEYSIDHFKPKSNPEYYNIVCQWENLYICCHNCQRSKVEQFNENILRPDSEEYSFEDYYIYNYSTHEIDIRPDISDSKKIKALATREIFGFNHGENPKAREISFDRYRGKISLGETIEINDFPYRYAIEML